MANPSNQEQLMLELVNRARLDPAAEAKRFGMGLNDGLAAGTLNATTKAPLAMNGLLIDSSREHSQWMLDTNTFSHTGDAGSSPHDRMEDAGYVFGFPGSSGENISVSGTTGTPDLTALIISQHEGLFRSPGHRTNILDSDFGFREIGIGQKVGPFTFTSGTFNSSMVTQNFARSGDTIFLTGVVYDDTSGNDFYSVGEGDGGVAVAAGGKATVTTSSGGYAVTSSAGKVKVVFGSGSTAVEVQATLRNENAKIDLVDGNTLMSSVTLKLLKNVKAATLLGLNKLDITGGAAAETLTGNKGANKLAGGGGNDKLAGMAGKDKLLGGGGKDKLSGNAGKDRLEGGNGNDTLDGGAGKDVLVGDKGADKLKGGGGGDVFLFRKLGDSTVNSKGRDTILDFKRGQGDKINLDKIDARTDLNGNQAFDFVGKAGFSGKSGELRYSKSGKDVIVSGDVNGDGVADFAIKVAGVAALQTGDFIL